MDSQPFSVIVPASTSNLGSGFDTVSAALSLYLRVMVRPGTEPGIDWGPEWEGRSGENVLQQSLDRTLERFKIAKPSLRILMENPIPLSRGLGSSGAAVIAGIKIAEHLGDLALTSQETLELGYPLEGHPENMAASLLGGWVISRTGSDGVRSHRLDSRLACRFVVAIPDQQVATREARKILPESYSLQDVVHNLQRCALLVHALHDGDRTLLRDATTDRIHQAYRAELVAGIPALLLRAGCPEPIREHLLSVSISGSGSCVLAICDGDYDRIGDWMVETLAQHGTEATFRVLDLDQTGVRIQPDP